MFRTDVPGNTSGTEAFLEAMNKINKNFAKLSMRSSLFLVKIQNIDEKLKLINTAEANKF